MSSSQAYPSMTSTIDSKDMSANATPDVVCTEWYYQPIYAYNDPYNTPFPTSTFPSSTFPSITFPTTTVEDQSWNGFVRTPVSDVQLDAYNIQQQHMMSQSIPAMPQLGDMMPLPKESTRSRSSPSRLGPFTNTDQWTPQGLGIQYSSASSGQPTPPVSSTFPPEMNYYTATSSSLGQPTPPVTSTFPPESFQSYAAHTSTEASPLPTRHSRPVRQSRNLAPVPKPLASSSTSNLKRASPSDENETSTPPSTSNKRLKRTPSTSTPSVLLSSEDRLLVHLREDLSLPWKEIIARFKSTTGKPFQIAQLQMRYKRLREKYRNWEDSDTEALKAAVEEWERGKWEIVSAKMLSYGVEEKWPPGTCARKWKLLLEKEVGASQSMTPVTTSQLSSPVDGAFAYPFLPNL